MLFLLFAVVMNRTSSSVPVVVRPPPCCVPLAACEWEVCGQHGKHARLAWQARGQGVGWSGEWSAGVWAQGMASGRPSQARHAASA
jgi:hypothetical protein